MLTIYRPYLTALHALRAPITRIEGRDTDLAKQLRRAAASVALNIAEGSGSQAGTRRQRYLSALGSANEVLACLDVAVALGYCDPAPQVANTVKRTISTLITLSGLRSS